MKMFRFEKIYLLLFIALTAVSLPAVVGAANWKLYNFPALPLVDSQVRVRIAGSTVSLAASPTCPSGSVKVKISSTATSCLATVDTTNARATKVRVKTGAGVKAIRQYGEGVKMTTYQDRITANFTTPAAIAFDGTNMWAAFTGITSHVIKITPNGGMTFFDGNNVVGIAFDGTNMWTADNGSVTKIAPNGTQTRYNVPNQPGGIAFDGTNMWTANNGSVTKIAPSGVMTTYTGNVEGNIFETGTPCIAFDGTNMWTVNYIKGSVTKVAPNGAMTTYTGIGKYIGSTGSFPVSIAFDGTNMWTANRDHTVTKVSPGGAMITYTGVGNPSNGDFGRPVAIAFDGTNMWTANYDGSVTKITSDGHMTTYTGVEGHPQSIAFDGTNMWTANSFNNSITKITLTVQ